MPTTKTAPKKKGKNKLKAAGVLYQGDSRGTEARKARARARRRLARGMELTETTVQEPLKAGPIDGGAWVEPFLRIVEQTGNVPYAARQVGMRPRYISEYRRSHPEFREQVDAAKIIAVAELEEVARRRAVESSDQLMVLLLKANKPEKYRDGNGSQGRGSGLRGTIEFSFQLAVRYDPDAQDREEEDDEEDSPSYIDPEWSPVEEDSPTSVTEVPTTLSVP